MKVLLKWFSSATIALLLVVGFQASVLAQPQSQPMDCTNGCYILTCHNGYCQLWYCSGSTGCRVVSEFQELEKALKGEADGSLLRSEVAYASVCPTKLQCDLYELAGKEAVLLGTFDNIEGITDEQRTLRDALRRFDQTK